MRSYLKKNRPTTAGKAEVRIIKRVLPYLWPKKTEPNNLNIKLRVVIALLLLVCAKVATVITPFFYKAAVDALAVPGSISSSQFLAFSPLLLVVAYGVARITNVGFAQLRDAVFAKVGQRALRMLALRTFRHIHALSLRFHIQRKTGALSRIIERGVKGVDFLLRFMLFSIIPLMFELILVAGIFFVKFSPTYFTVIMLTIALYIIFTFRITEWRVKIRQRMNDEDTEANQKAIDSLLNFETVKYFNAEERETHRYDRSMQSYERLAIKTQTSLAMLNAGQSAVISVGLVIVMALAAQGVIDGALSVGDFVLVNALMIQITLPLGFLGTVYREIRQSLIDMKEMFDLLDSDLEITDKPNAVPLNTPEGTVTFTDLDFAYEPDRPILKNINFHVPAGNKLAIVGPSGSGKSTIARLLFRFYDPTNGHLSIDNQNIQDVTQNSLRASMGVVPQDTVLFNDTIGYNIGYGHEHATETDIINAAKAAHIHDFVNSLPDGYDTRVGERGLKLSGGEKQRVAIARTILKNPKILILDEATSALDTNTEKEIQQSLETLSANRTTITIAHRLSTIADADEIIVLSKGEITERGTHTDLINQNGTYAQMWHNQKKQNQGE